ncbi:MAG: Holliday junction resolvase RuvX [Anaerolineae bacterium]|nr:Holliday junction resolvase RuvX [Anaerolineae bacterium]
MAVILALDVGERRIGAAVGSTESGLARPYAVWQSHGRERDAMRIRELAAETGADLLLVGLPLQSDGTPSPQAERVRRYVEGMIPSLPLPVEFRDEAYSTQDAQALLRESGAGRRRRRELEDAAAAAVILQSYLDSTGCRTTGAGS